MRVGAQGCPTLYKSQVFLSTKDTPLVPKLRIKSQDDGILCRPPIILLPATHLLEPVGGIQRARRGVRFPHLQVNLPDAASGEHLQNLLHERAAQPVAPSRRRHGEIQNFALVGGFEGDDVADDRPPRAPRASRLGDENVGIGRDAVAKVLRRPGVGEDFLLDRADRGDIAELSGTNLEGVGRSAPPISLELRRGDRRRAPRCRHRRAVVAPLRTRKA